MLFFRFFKALPVARRSGFAKPIIRIEKPGHVVAENYYS